jgi:hypothetical protein
MHIETQVDLPGIYVKISAIKIGDINTGWEIQDFQHNLW